MEMEAAETAAATYDLITIAGTMLLLIGFGMCIVEIFFPALGLLGITGVGAMVIGALVLHNNGGLEQIGLNWAFIAAFIITGVGLSAGGGWLAWKAMQKEVTTGPESFIGELALVVDWEGHEGHVHIQGENWQAYGPEGLNPKDKVTIAKADGVRLKVIKS